MTWGSRKQDHFHQLQAQHDEGNQPDWDPHHPPSSSPTAQPDYDEYLLLHTLLHAVQSENEDLAALLQKMIQSHTR